MTVSERGTPLARLRKVATSLAATFVLGSIAAADSLAKDKFLGRADDAYKSGNWTEAERLYGKAVQERLRTADTDDLAPIYKKLAGVFHRQGKLQEESSALIELAALHRERKQFDKSDACFRRAIGIATRAFGPDHATTVGYMRSYISMLLQVGRQEEALRVELRMRATTGKRLDPPFRSAASHASAHASECDAE